MFQFQFCTLILKNRDQTKSQRVDIYNMYLYVYMYTCIHVYICI